MGVGGDGFVRRLSAARIGDTFNFYRRGRHASLRRARLSAYLDSHGRAPFLLVGEAAGHRGARVSGIPFTSERQVTGTGPTEATATIVHAVLRELGIEGRVLLWNVVPTHPHRPGEPASNRRPTALEVEAALPFLQELTLGRRTVAVGRIAHGVLGGPYVRHPSHGGAPAFRSALLELVGVGRR